METIQELLQAFPPAILAFLAAVSVGYLLCMASPLLLAAWAVRRHQPALPRGWLFSFVLLVGSYGLLVAINFLALVPTQAYLVFIGPQLAASNLVNGGYLTRAADFFVQYWWLMFGPALFVVSVFLSRFLSPRWAAICKALEG